MSGRWILDTNIVSLAARGDESVLTHLARSRRRDLATTAITIAELEFGSRRSTVPGRHREQWQDLVRGFPVLSFTKQEAPEHARLRDELRSRPIEERDLLIAAIAVSNGFGVVTRNVGEFKRVRGLKVEGWG
jgi:tRNA(fMet)-specific endonuclease VapC